MTRRHKWITLLSPVILILGTVIAFRTHRASQDTALQEKVYYWIRSMDWWDRNLTESENVKRRLDGLRTMGDDALTVLERDLNYHPSAWRILNRIPFLQPFAPEPLAAEQAQETRQRAVHFLGALGSNAIRSLPKLLQVIPEAGDSVRLEFASTLGLIGVGSPQVCAALTNLLADPSPEVRFSSALSLWQLDRSSATNVNRVRSFINPNYLSWPSMRLREMGKDATVFVPDLRKAIDGMPWSQGRIAAVDAIWRIAGDRQLVLSELDSLKIELEHPTKTNRLTGWTQGENDVGYAAAKLSGEPEFSKRLRPMLEWIRQNKNSRARRMAEGRLREFDGLDGR